MLKICISYILTTVLLTAFIYFVLSMGVRNTRDVRRIREDLDEIQQTVLHLPEMMTHPPTPKCGCGCQATPNSVEPRELNGIVDAMLKRKLANIMDDLYTLKKQVQGTGCSFFGSKDTAAPATDATSAVAKPKTRVNYASEELGARVLFVDAVPIGGTNPLKALLGLDFSANPPVNILKPSLAPGSCFGYKGNKAAVTVQLAKEIIVESFVIAHVPKEMTPNSCTNSAPKDFVVYGINGKSCNSAKVPCGQFQYSNSPGRRSQEFAFKEKRKFSKLRFQFNTNHGNPNYTCIYRLEVYGRLT